MQNTFTHWIIRLVVSLLMVSIANGTVMASSNDHDLARAALASGEILPLSAILTKLEKDYPGQIIEVELEREKGRWIYEIKLLQKNGLRQKLKIDAKTAVVISDKRK
jgi:uncharacterized membrane protein YkoI